MDGQAELLEVVDALRPPGRLARRLHGGQQQGDQDRDDRDTTRSSIRVKPRRCMRILRPGPRGLGPVGWVTAK